MCGLGRKNIARDASKVWRREIFSVGVSGITNHARPQLADQLDNITSCLKEIILIGPKNFEYPCNFSTQTSQKFSNDAWPKYRRPGCQTGDLVIIYWPWGHSKLISSFGKKWKARSLFKMEALPIFKVCFPKKWRSKIHYERSWSTNAHQRMGKFWRQWAGLEKLSRWYRGWEIPKPSARQPFKKLSEICSSKADSLSLTCSSIDGVSFGWAEKELKKVGGQC